MDIIALSALRTPEVVADFATNALKRADKAIIAGAGGAGHLTGVVAAFTALPVGVKCRSSITIGGCDGILSILQMPEGIPMATVALDNAQNAAILATQTTALSDQKLNEKI